MPPDDRRCAFRLKAHHLRKGLYLSVFFEFPITLPIRGNISRVPYRDEMIIRVSLKRFTDLKGAGLLSLDAVRIQRIDKGYRIFTGYLFYEFQCFIEIPFDGKHLSAVDYGLG